MHPSENARLNSGRASRFVSGAASEIDRKYHAASGSVKASAPSAPIEVLALLFLQGFFYNESQWILNTT